MRNLLCTILIFQSIICLSCDNFELSDKVNVGAIDTVKNGIFKIQIKLNRNKPGWNIHFGDPFSKDFKKGIIANNSEIMDNILTIKIYNDSKYYLTLWSLYGEVTIQTGYNIVYYNGTLKNLMINTNPITLISANGPSDYKLSIEVSFRNKNTKINDPIPIVAEWHDAL